MPTKVLVVDDERPIADTLHEILCRAGYDCAVAYSGAEALELIHALHPALMISDVIMPGLNGLDLARRVRNAHKCCAVLLFSGNAATQDLLKISHNEGPIFEVLAKPVPPRELLATVARILSSKPNAPGKAHRTSGHC